MNWLAHVFLSPDNLNFQLGNLLTDVSNPKQLKIDNADFKAGVQCHYAIDKFTDSHELVKKCKAVFFPKYRHFSAVLVDIFFDHFLAANWDDYCETPYRKYVDSFYSSIEQKTLPLHESSETFIKSIYTSDRLGMYDKLEGIQQTLERITKRIRLRTIIDIRESMDELKGNYDVLLTDFRKFFPELREHVKEF